MRGFRGAVAGAAFGAVVISALAGCAGTATSSAAGAAPSASIAGAIDATGAPFVGSRKSKKYYPTGCQTVSLIKAADRVGFASMQDAEKAGFAKDLYSTDCRY
jgi:hypothetical protein